MIDLSATTAQEKLPPGRVADWSVAISPSDPLVTAGLLTKKPFAGLDSLAGAGLSALSGTPPPLMTFDRAGHYAELDVDAQSGLSGGGFSLVLHRAHAPDYDKLIAAKAACDDKGALLLADLSLGWSANRGVLGLLGPASQGLEPAGRFAITEIAQSVDGPSYRITLHGREAIAHRLSLNRIKTPVTAKTPELAVAALMDQMGFAPTDYTTPQDNPVPPPATPGPELKLTLGAEGLAEAERLGTLIEALARREGRGPFLIRDDVLHIGVARAIPFKSKSATGKVIRVSAATGLIRYTETRGEPRNPKFDFAAEYEAKLFDAKPDIRRAFRLDLVGAPEIRPGDVVAFPRAKDPSDTALLRPGVAEDWSTAIELYVATVSHRISMNAGFLTTLTGVQVETASPSATAIWNVPTEAPVTSQTAPARRIDDGSPEGALAAAVTRQVDRALNRLALPQVGEVASAVPGTGGDPALLPLGSNLVVGLSDSGPIQRRSAINPLFRGGEALTSGVPYLSPFAWGPYGLVVPRYPGTRVMLLPGHGEAEDVVDIGALWAGPTTDAAARPVNAQEGDWWLKLPARIDSALEKDVIAGPVLPNAGDLATNDLTDADGTRIVEVGRLVIRVGDKALKPAADRPSTEGVDAGVILIEHKDGEALMQIDQNGTITLKAKSVVVEVSGSMDVKKT